MVSTCSGGLARLAKGRVSGISLYSESIGIGVDQKLPSGISLISPSRGILDQCLPGKHRFFQHIEQWIRDLILVGFQSTSGIIGQRGEFRHLLGKRLQFTRGFLKFGDTADIASGGNNMNHVVRQIDEHFFCRSGHLDFILSNSHLGSLGEQIQRDILRNKASSK